MIALTILLVLTGGILLLKRIYFPQPGRIYHHPEWFSSGRTNDPNNPADWLGNGQTEKEFEEVYGSPGKPALSKKMIFCNGGNYALFWEGRGALHVVFFDAKTGGAM